LSDNFHYINIIITHTHTTVLRLCGICPGQPGWAGTRRNIQPLTLIVVINHPYLLSPSTTIHGILINYWEINILISGDRFYSQNCWLQHPFNGLFSRTTWVSQHQKGEQFWILMTQEMTGWHISWTICKSFIPHSKQITVPAPHHSFFTGRMLFLTPNWQCQSTEGTNWTTDMSQKFWWEQM